MKHLWTILIISGYAWLILSIIDVISHNLDAVPHYAFWNLFGLIFGG
jgi:hypothetical protein